MNTDRYQIFFDEKDELPHNRFTEICDPNCHEWINKIPIKSMKSKLNSLTGRKSIEEDWENSTEFNTKEQISIDFASTIFFFKLAYVE